ncbi:hypothetical protein GW17_00042721, partial [Ensete ventricosum]
MGKPLAPLAEEEAEATEKATSQLIRHCGEEMQEDKKTKVKKGSLTVRVGLEDGEDGGGTRKFVIPISYLYHPLFKRLLESAQEVYGYHSSGPLKLPCSVDDFLHLRSTSKTKDKANKNRVWLNCLTEEVLPVGPEAGETPGSVDVPGTEDLGVVIVPPASAGDGDGARNESCSTVVGGGMTG